MKFVYPVLPDSVATLIVNIESSAPPRTLELDEENVAWVTGNVADLVSIERAVNVVNIRVSGALEDVSAPAPTRDWYPFHERIERFDETPHRALFHAFVAARHVATLGNDLAKDIAGRMLAAAQSGEPTDTAFTAKLIEDLERAEAAPRPQARYFEVKYGLAVLRTAIEGSTSDLVLTAMAASAGLGVSDAELSETLRFRATTKTTRERRWLTVLGEALGRLDAIEPAVIEVLARALRSTGLGTSPELAAPQPRLHRTGPPAQPRIVETNIAGVTLKVIQTEDVSAKLFRAEVDGQARRVIARTNDGDWVVGDDGEIEELAKLLEYKAKREESGERLTLVWEDSDPILRSSEYVKVTVAIAPSGDVIVDITAQYVAGSFY